MTKEQKVDDILKRLGHDMTHKEFKKQNKLSIEIRDSWSSGITITNTDPFHASYTDFSLVEISSNQLSSWQISDDHIKKVETRIKAKIRQRVKLEEIREYAIPVIKTFLSRSFGINEEIITREDIVFKLHNRFLIGKAEFHFSGTISNKEFHVSSNSWMSYAQVYGDVKKVHAYFYDRQEGLLAPKQEVAHD